MLHPDLASPRSAGAWAAAGWGAIGHLKSTAKRVTILSGRLLSAAALFSFTTQPRHRLVRRRSIIVGMDRRIVC